MKATFFDRTRLEALALALIFRLCGDVHVDVSFLRGSPKHAGPSSVCGSFFGVWVLCRCVGPFSVCGSFFGVPFKPNQTTKNTAGKRCRRPRTRSFLGKAGGLKCVRCVESVQHWSPVLEVRVPAPFGVSKGKGVQGTGVFQLLNFLFRILFSHGSFQKLDPFFCWVSGGFLG